MPLQFEYWVALDGDLVILPVDANIQFWIRTIRITGWKFFSMLWNLYKYKVAGWRRGSATLLVSRNSHSPCARLYDVLDTYGYDFVEKVVAYR